MPTAAISLRLRYLTKNNQDTPRRNISLPVVFIPVRQAANRLHENQKQVKER